MSDRCRRKTTKSYCTFHERNGDVEGFVLTLRNSPPRCQGLSLFARRFSISGMTLGNCAASSIT
jgi:hypothetical protein